MEHLEMLVTTFATELSDPTRVYLLGIPVAVVLLTAIGIAMSRARSRRIERENLQVLLGKQPATPSVSELPKQTEAIPSKPSLMQRFNDGLAKTRDQLAGGLQKLLSGNRTLDPQLQEQVHELLYRADLGVGTATKLVERLRQQFAGQVVEWSQIKQVLRQELLALFPAQQPALTGGAKPQVLLIVGVNGVGKTTTVAKLAANFQAEGKSVLLCAADTFRAAAIDQLQVWGKRLEIDVIAHQQGSDPASVAFDAVKAAVARSIDVVIIDTAGRLHNKKELMDELAKVKRVVSRDLPGAPHESWLVVDATTGQNALVQIKAFKEVAELTGIIVTKLDGTAKGGVVAAAADQFGLPIRYIGVGEAKDDLRAFNPELFIDSILGANS